MAKCLRQKANAKSLIFHEPCNARVDGSELQPSIPTSGAFAHTDEGNYVYAAIGYTFSYMHTFLKDIFSTDISFLCQVWSSLPKRGDRAPKPVSSCSLKSLGWSQKGGEYGGKRGQRHPHACEDQAGQLRQEGSENVNLSDAAHMAGLAGRCYSHLTNEETGSERLCATGHTHLPWR